MSLPALTTAGAVYRGAWRAQDAVLENTNQPVSVPSLVGGAGATMLARYAVNSGEWEMFDGASANTTYSPTGLVDGGPTISSDGVAGFYTQQANILNVAVGAAKRYSMMIRCRWSYGQRFAGACGFEHWVQNQCAYLENGADGAPNAQTQLDRGQSRRQQGTAAYSNVVKNFEVQVNTSENMSCFIDEEGTAENVFSFAAPQAEWSAYMTGPVQRTAGGIYTYTGNALSWSRHVIVESDAGFLNGTDRTNLRSWLDGTDFPPSAQSPVLFWMCA